MNDIIIQTYFVLLCKSMNNVVSTINNIVWNPGSGGVVAADRALFFCPHPYGAGKVFRSDVSLSFWQA